MSILVAYASRRGATRGIAERIAESLRYAGLDADVRPVRAAGDLAACHAFVIGSAAYMFHWMRDATSFVRRSRTLLAGRPVWLFSSGPLGTETVESDRRDLRTLEPREIEGLRADIRPRDHCVFFGAFDPGNRPVGLTERLVMKLPAARAAFPAGDFRDWQDIETWARGIASELATMPAGRG